MLNPQESNDLDTKSYHIYALIDPRDNLVYYVGLSMDAYKRFYEHLNGMHGNLQEKLWIEDLKQNRLRPVLHLLETIEAGVETYITACKRELYWIREMAILDHPLLNRSGISRNYVPLVRQSRKFETITDIDYTLEKETIAEEITTDGISMPEGESWLTTDEIAKELKVNVKTVRAWINSGELAAVDVGGEYRVSRSDFDNFIQRRRIDRREKQ